MSNPRKPLDPACTGDLSCPVVGHLETRHHSRGTTRAHQHLTMGQRATLAERRAAAVPAPTLTSVVQLASGALSNGHAAGVLEEALAACVSQMAQAAHNLGSPAQWDTFRARVERSDPAPVGLDTSLRLRATVDVTE